jgi:hypothetical protein
MERPIIFRHGSKGGRFIDGMYITKQELTQVTGITIIQDTGIYSDHDLVRRNWIWESINSRSQKIKKKDFTFAVS